MHGFTISGSGLWGGGGTEYQSMMGGSGASQPKMYGSDSAHWAHTALE